MGPVSERKAKCQFQTKNSLVCGNTLHHTDGHGAFKERLHRLGLAFDVAAL